MNWSFSKKSSVTINGKNFSGNNLTIINGKVILDNVEIHSQSPNNLTIKIEGDLANLNSDAPVVVEGNVHGYVTVDGPVTCGDIGGNVRVEGPLTCENINGDADVEGPVMCSSIGGRLNKR